MKKENAYLYQQRGVTLLEVLITLIVLGVGLLAMAQLQVAVIQDNSIAKKRTAALLLAQTELEQFREFTSPTNFDTSIVDGRATPPPVNNVPYTVDSAVIPDVPGGLAVATRNTITTTVAWPNSDTNITVLNDPNNSITLNTIISRTDPRRSGLALIGVGGIPRPTTHNDGIDGPIVIPPIIGDDDNPLPPINPPVLPPILPPILPPVLPPILPGL